MNEWAVSYLEAVVRGGSVQWEPQFLNCRDSEAEARRRLDSLRSQPTKYHNVQLMTRTVSEWGGVD